MVKPSWEAADEYVGTWQLWNFISRFQGGRERKRKSRWQQNESVYMWNQSSAQRAFPVILFHNIICCLFGWWVFKNLISKNNSKVFQEQQRIKSGASHKRLTSLSSLAFSPLRLLGDVSGLWWCLVQGRVQRQLVNTVGCEHVRGTNSSPHPSLVSFQQEQAQHKAIHLKTP